MRISDWSSDVCSSDLIAHRCSVPLPRSTFHQRRDGNKRRGYAGRRYLGPFRIDSLEEAVRSRVIGRDTPGHVHHGQGYQSGIGNHQMKRSEEHTSELQSLMRISYAVFCLKTKNKKTDAKDIKIIQDK